MRIPYDSPVNYQAHPNGQLPDPSQVHLQGRGSNVLTINCTRCHSRTPDFVFSGE